MSQALVSLLTFVAFFGAWGPAVAVIGLHTGDWAVVLFGVALTAAAWWWAGSDLVRELAMERFGK